MSVVNTQFSPSVCFCVYTYVDRGGGTRLWGGGGVDCVAFWPENSAIATLLSAVIFLTVFSLQNQCLRFPANCFAISCQCFDSTKRQKYDTRQDIDRRCISPCQKIDTTICDIYVTLGVAKLQQKKNALAPCNPRSNHYIHIIAGWHDADRHHPKGELR